MELTHSDKTLSQSLNLSLGPNSLRTLQPDFYVQSLIDVNQLWGELGIPQSDIKAFMESYGTEATPENIYAVQHQLQMLQDHKQATVDILFLIRHREDYLYNLKLQINSCLDQDSKTMQLLEKYRLITLRIIEEIVHWRQLMWKPQPFIWEHKNYLFKINQDAKVFSSKNAKMFMKRTLLNFSDNRLLIPKDGCFNLLVNDAMLERLVSAVKVLDTEKEVQQQLTDDMIRSNKYIPVLKWKPRGKTDYVDKTAISPFGVHMSPEEEEELNNQRETLAKFTESIAKTGKRDKSKFIGARFWKIELVSKDVVLPPTSEVFQLSIYLIGPPPQGPSPMLLFQIYSSESSTISKIIIELSEPIDTDTPNLQGMLTDFIAKCYTIQTPDQHPILCFENICGDITVAK